MWMLKDPVAEMWMLKDVDNGKKIIHRQTARPSETSLKSTHIHIVVRSTRRSMGKKGMLNMRYPTRLCRLWCLCWFGHDSVSWMGHIWSFPALTDQNGKSKECNFLGTCIFDRSAEYKRTSVRNQNRHCPQTGFRSGNRWLLNPFRDRTAEDRNTISWQEHRRGFWAVRWQPKVAVYSHRLHSKIAVEGQMTAKVGLAGILLVEFQRVWQWRRCKVMSRKKEGLDQFEEFIMSRMN